MEEKELHREPSRSGGLTSNKEIEAYIDASFMLLSTMINEKYDEVDERIKHFPVRITSAINKNIVDSSHRLYVNICNENFKKNEELKRKIVFRLNVLIGIGGVLLILGVLHLIQSRG